MRRLLFAIVMTAFVVGSWADDATYSYLIFTDTNGTNTSIALDNLVITVSNGQLVVSNPSGTQTFTLAQLVSMQFSATADGTVGVGKVEGAHSDSLRGNEGKIYDLNGRRVHSSLSSLQSRKGIYMLRTPDGQTSKIAVK